MLDIDLCIYHVTFDMNNYVIQLLMLRHVNFTSSIFCVKEMICEDDVVSKPKVSLAPANPAQ